MKKIILALLLGGCLQTALAQTTVVDSMLYGGVEHYYRVYIPANHKCSMILHLHGYGSGGLAEQLYTNYMPIADTAGFIAAWPDGLIDGFGNRYWNVSVLNPNTDDVGFISAFIDSLCRWYAIDKGAVFASGLSNGGFMCHKLACELSNKIAAIASVSAAMTTEQYNTCSPLRAVPVMEIHGTADGTVPYTGTPGYIMDVDSTVKRCVTLDNCNPVPVHSLLPHNAGTTNGTTVDHYVYTGGTNGATCELYRINGGAHVEWPGFPGENQDFNQSVEIWRFFRSYYQPGDCSSVGIKEAASLHISFYPNPCKDYIHIDVASPAMFIITDMQGRKVLSSNKKDMDVSMLPAGIYFLQMDAGTIHATEKLVKIF
jgi:polyhydroxybutyrate depolymerase